MIETAELPKLGNYKLITEAIASAEKLAFQFPRTNWVIISDSKNKLEYELMGTATLDNKGLKPTEVIYSTANKRYKNIHVSLLGILTGFYLTYAQNHYQDHGKEDELNFIKQLNNDREIYCKALDKAFGGRSKSESVSLYFIEAKHYIASILSPTFGRGFFGTDWETHFLVMSELENPLEYLEQFID